jgi:GTPase
MDTPGLNEVAGEERARLARETAKRCDLVLFVVSDDLLDVQYDELRRLGEVGRPIILVFNKSDLRSPQELATLLEHIRSQRLPRFMSPDDVVAVSANPKPVVYVRERPDGTVVEELRRPPPEIEGLKVRILEVLQREGKALLAVNSAIFAADSSDKLAAVKARLRQQAADRLILRYAAAKAAAVALTPLPVIDIAGAALVDAKMVHGLASVCGIRLSRSRVDELLKSIAISAGWVTAGEVVTHVVAGLLKAGTFGMSTLMTAPIQGLAAAYGSYVVGHAAKYWVEHGQGWGREGPKTVVHRILKQARAGTVVRSLKDEIEQQMKRNRHVKA